MSAAVPAAGGRRCATYLPRSAFSRALRDRVDEYFERNGKRRRDLSRMYAKTAIMLAWLIASYLGLLGATNWGVGALLAVSLGLAMAGIGFNVQHDGSHGSYSSLPIINGIMARSLDLLGGSAYFWRFKHNIAHHTHTNITGQDDDINLGALGRLSPYDRWHRLHRFQHIYIWGLYALLAVEWQTSGEYRNLLTKTHSGTTRVPRLCAREKGLFWAGRAVFCALAFVIPLSRQPVASVVMAYLVVAVTLGLVLATVFQLAHCVERATFSAMPADSSLVSREWAAVQVESTVDFARDNHVLGWYLGGLNFQIEHHLFPRICHVHYRALAPIVEAVCREHGVRYSANPTVGVALRSHYRWLKRMGRDPRDPRGSGDSTSGPAVLDAAG